MIRLRLSTRIILFVVLLQATMLSLLIWGNERLMNARYAAMFEQTAHTGAHLVANALVSGRINQDPAALQEALDLLHDEKAPTYADVRGPDGRSMAGLGQPAAPWRADQGFSIALAGLGLVLTATLFISLFLTRHLRRLEAAAHSLKQDQLGHRITIDSADEIGDIAHAFNHLVQHLGETRFALQEKHNALQRETRFLQTLLDGIDAVVIEMRPSDYCFTYVSCEAQNLTGHAEAEWLAPGFWFRHVAEDDRCWLQEAIANHIAKGQSFTADFRMTHRQGHTLWVRAINSVEQRGEDVPVIRGLLLDITEQKTAEDRIVYLAEHDSLTDLINRPRFQKELEQAIAYTQHYQQQGALLFMDLDQFKYVNDTYGHQYGDEYLLDVSRRLARVLRRTDILGRLGGDEFGVIIPKSSFAEAHAVGTALLGVLAQEHLEHDGKVVPVGASIGIALFPSQGAIPGDLLAKADAAMYTAKRQGRGQVHIFSEEDTELWNMQAKIHWEERIRWALAEDKFLLYYQPVVNLRSGRVTHYEALLRMQGEDGEIIAPGAFIETAERFGLIRDIDRWVVKKAIQVQAASIAAQRPVTLAINLSGRHFGSILMLEYVQQTIQEFGANPGSLIFEVTETEAVENLSKAQEFINALRSIGCKFALDDFGIGFSSFHYLRNLPVDYIKIDGSFVCNLHTDTDDRLFVKAIVDLSQGLDIPCIAEFVENGHIVNVLTELGVELGQGYHLARPVPEFIASGFVQT